MRAFQIAMGCVDLTHNERLVWRISGVDTEVSNLLGGFDEGAQQQLLEFSPTVLYCTDALWRLEENGSPDTTNFITEAHPLAT